jgi:uncharacterized protein (TIGR02300 family)
LPFDTARGSDYGGALQRSTEVNVAKADLGIKRLCPSCGAKYYDLNKDPILCPKCGTLFEVTRSRAVAAPEPDEDEAEAEEAENAQFVSLEEADEEAAGGVSEDDEDAEAGEEDEKDAFLEVEDEEEGDVSDIIGDVDEEEQ